MSNTLDTVEQDSTNTKKESLSICKLEKRNMHNMLMGRIPDSAAPIYICTVCGKRISYDESYSDGLFNMHCWDCIVDKAKLYGIPTGQYISKHIHNAH